MLAKYKTWVAIGVLSAVGLIYHYSFSYPGLEKQMVGQGGKLSEVGRTHIVDALNATQPNSLQTLLANNPGLIRFLADAIIAYGLQNKWDKSSADHFFNTALLLQQLIESQQADAVKSQLKENKNTERLIPYLQAFLSFQRSNGGGYVSNNNEADQRAALQAYKLLVSLNETRDLHKELRELAVWYRSERAAQPQSNLLQAELLHYAWGLSTNLLNLDLANETVNLTKNLESATDLTRLLNHENDSVVMNAAHLISFFTPQNAVNALRFQVLRRKSNPVRFLLLDAIKMYAEHRQQLQPQLNKMLRLTRDTALQKKIIETIDHLNGKSAILKATF